MAEEWTVEQLRFIEWLATPRYIRTPPTEELLAEELNLSDRTLTRWKHIDGWQDAVNREARKSIGKKLPEVYGALVREAEKGNYQHIQLIMEMTGEYTKTQRNINNSDIKGEITLRFVEEEIVGDDDP